MTETIEYIPGSKDPHCITLTGIVHPSKGERFSCDVGHMEIFPDDNDADILSDALYKFAGKRVKITIVEVRSSPS